MIDGKEVVRRVREWQRKWAQNHDFIQFAHLRDFLDTLEAECAETVEPAEPEKCCGTCEHYGKDDENDDWLCNNLDTPYIEGCDLKYKFYCNHHTAKEVRDEH